MYVRGADLLARDGNRLDLEPRANGAPATTAVETG
jgi:hypothetical protein